MVLWVNISFPHDIISVQIQPWQENFERCIIFIFTVLLKIIYFIEHNFDYILSLFQVVKYVTVREYTGELDNSFL